MAPSRSSEPPEGPPPGPHPSYIQIAKPYIFEPKIQECLLAGGVTETRDDTIRLQAVAWIDSVRRALHLPVRTYNTAVVYFHKFRLVHPDNSGFIDAAAAALFTACKIEDTLKKSRDILCAAHNLKLSASEQLTPDDPIFENHAKVIIGVERLMLEASGFDFRNRYPQRLLLKVAKFYQVDKDAVGKTAYNMSLDLYRTFAPLKQTTSTMAIACVELAGRILDKPVTDFEAGKDYEKWRTTRQEIMETLLDLLDLYTHHRASTIVGQDHALEKFISIRIALNQEASSQNLARFTQSEGEKALTNGTISNGIKEQKSPKSLTSPRGIVSPKDVRSPQPMGLTSVTGTPVQGKPGLKDGTVRFMLDPERARHEKHTVAEFFKMDEEEYEVEVENNDRRRDSAIDMSLLDEEASDGDKSRCIDLEPPSDDAIIWETTASGGFSSEQKHPQPVNVDGVIGARAAPPSRKTNKPLADQTVAFQNALLQAPGALLSIRGGRARHLAKDYYAGQENDPKAVMGGDGGSFHAQPGAASRKTKIPLADQAVAFQDALQRSTGASPSSIGGGVLLQNTEREEAAAAARKYAKLRRKNAAKMRKKREQQQGQMG